MRIPLGYPVLFVLIVLLPAAANAQKQVTTPLGNTLSHALNSSSLTTPGSHPFHLKMHIHGLLISAGLQADIEEYWASPTLWKRTVTAKDFSQTTIVNDTGMHIETTGEYLPIWLRTFVNALFDPVHDIASWEKPGASLVSTILPSGQPTPPCLNRTLRTGDNAQSFVSSICFYEGSAFARIESPGYSLDFNEFGTFHDKNVAHLYITHATGEYFLAGKIGLLEDSGKKPDFFVSSPGLPTTDGLDSILLAQSSLERLASGPIQLSWPHVASGKVSGVVNVFVSVDRKGRLREANILSSDNRALNQTLREQLLKMQWKAASSKGSPVQVEGMLSLPFSTATSEGEGTTGETIEVPVSIESKNNSGRKISGNNPSFPIAAKEKHLQGSVLLAAFIGKDGKIKNLDVIDSPDPSFTTAASDAVKTWVYRPYLVDDKPTEVETTITVNFNYR
ncbi:MAG: hypothetical protein JWM43_1492 [Acidobacteriaceae bacterium]|nr:hypothetical protein [Acidobacteriaceae bacterium]